MCGSDVFLGLIAILFPPLAVWVKCGICSADSVINILLCVLGFIPGLLHAWYIIAKFPDPSDYEQVSQDSEHGNNQRVTYVFVPHNHQQPPKPANAMNYGSTANSNNAASSSSAAPANVNASDDHAPPTYAEAVKGDNKIQSRD